MAEVFISYASADREIASRLVAALESRGFSVWWDRHIHAGSFFTRVIEHELRRARCIVTLWSPHAVGSDWVVGESTVARDRRVLVPVLLEPCDVPPPFNTMQMLSVARQDGGEAEPWPGDACLEKIVAAVQTVMASQTLTVTEARAPRPELAVTATKPLVAVLPFESRHAEHEDLAETVAAEVLAALNQFSTLELVPRRTAFSPGYRDRSLTDVARAMEADYLITGRLSGFGDTARLMVELSDGPAGKQLFVTTRDTTVEQLLAETVAVAQALARQLGGEFLRSEILGATIRPGHGVDVWTLLNRARSHFVRFSEADLLQSLEFAERALELVPHEAHANAIKASVLAEMHVNAIPLEGVDVTAAARTAAQAALGEAGDDPVVMKYCGGVFGFLGEQRTAARLLRRSVSINPYDLGTWGYLCGVLVSLGGDSVDEVFATLDLIREESPRHPGIGFWELHRAVAHTVRGDVEAAATAAEDAVARQPGLAPAWWTLANALGRLGDLESAAGAATRALEENPRLTAARFVALHVGLSLSAADREQRSCGLVAAGLL